MGRRESRTIELSPDVRFQEVEGEAVLLDVERGEYFGLNEVGTRFWVHARETGDIDAIFERLLAEYEVEAETLMRDVEALVEDLARAGLVRLVTAAEPDEQEK
jgi:hypothetical protein